MTIQRLDPETVELSPLNTVVTELLQRIVPSAANDDPAVAARLFPDPSGGADRALDEDWKSYVEPDLRQLFQSALETVAEDIACLDMHGPKRLRSLRLPLSHLDPWIHGLNQARLAIAARHNLTELELEDEVIVDDEERALAVLQTHFYGFLQQAFLRELEDR